VPLTHPKRPPPHLKSMMKLAPLAAALLLAACASAAPPTGRLYTYVRSNQDGSLPETIYQYRASETHLEVGKIVSRCANAAFVTADMDLARGHGLRFTGGRIGRDANQEPFAYLEFDPASQTLRARIEQAGIDQSVAIAGAPFIIYDFDLSDLNAALAGRPARREDFRFAVSLIWPEPDSANIFRDLGWAEARFAAAESHLDRAAFRYEISGGLNGQLWLDARDGHVLEARLAEPNHTEYADFRLVLQNVEDEAAATWLEVRRAHWRDCP